MRGKSLLVIAGVILLTVCFIYQSYGETVYFVVGETDPNHNDSYVLPLTDANDIAYARELIKWPDIVLEPFVVAKIECGADWINRNYVSPMKAPWNWHVTEFNDFSETGGPYGHPAFVQNDCPGWMVDTDGYISFQNYTIVAELGTDPNHWERDFDSDGKVNNKDFSWLSGNWLDEDCNEPSWCGGSDLDESNSVDYNDLRIFSQSWLSPFADEPIWLGWWYEECWDNPRQCHGDADGLKQGSPRLGYSYVDTDDLDILTVALGASYGDFLYNPHADFDRDGDIDYDDGDILIRWYGVKEPPHGPGVPTDCPTQ